MHSDDALEHLIQQFSQPLAFLRELIQNSLDASTELIEVQVDYDPQSKGCVVKVGDTGEGMNREIIDERLTRLFSSSKENDLTKIGKFGIGFVSVFAVKPRLVVVETGRDGESWRLLFKEDRSFERRRLKHPVEGTSVTVFLTSGAKELSKLQDDCRSTIAYWCKYSDVEIRFNGKPINQRFEFPQAHYQYRLQLEGTECVVRPSRDSVAFHGYYNRGLTLLEGKGSPLPYLDFIIRSRYLEHTLTRDNIRQDQHYQKAMAQVRRAAFELMPDDLFGKLAERDDPLLWEEARSLALALNNRLKPAPKAPIFPAREGRLGLRDLPKRLYHSHQVTALWEAVEKAGETVIHGRRDEPKIRFLEQLGYEVLPLEEAFFHYRPSEAGPQEEQLLDSIASFARKLGLPQPVLIETLHCPLAWESRLGGLLDPRSEVLKGSARSKKWGYKLGLRKDHPTVKKLTSLHKVEPELAVYLALRKLSLELGLGRDHDTRLYTALSQTLMKRVPRS